MNKIGMAILGACGWCCAMAQAQQIQPPPARDDFSNEQAADLAPDVVPDPAVGLHYGRFRVLPTLDLGYSFDSNPTYLNKGAKPVSGIRATPDLELYLDGNGWDLYGRGWMIYEWLLGTSDTTSRDIARANHYGETVGGNYETSHGTRFSLSETFDYQNRNNYVSVSSPGGVYNGSWEDRYSLLVKGSVAARLSEKTGIQAGASYSDLWYSNTNLFGWRDCGVTLGFNRKVTEKTDAVLDFGYDGQESENASGLSHSYRALAGISSRPTAKTTYRVEAGVMEYTYNGNENSAFGWTYNLSGNWQVSRRVAFTMQGTAAFQPAEDQQNNYTVVQSLAAGMTFEATSRLMTSLGMTYRREDYANTAAGADKRIDNQGTVYGRASYQIFHSTSVFVGANFTKNCSTIGVNSYNRWFVESGVSLRF